MFQLSNASTALIDRCLQRQTPQAFGSFFQYSVWAALRRLADYQECYSNDGAGQPDIIAGRIGVEVKSSGTARIVLDGNYSDVRTQYEHFRLIGLRTDLMAMWAVEIPDPVPPTVDLGTVLRPQLTTDQQLESGLARELSWVLESAGSVWSDAQTEVAARAAIDRAVGGS